LVEYIAGIDLDPADDGSGRFQLAIAGQVRGARLFDVGVLRVEELRRKRRFGDCSGEHCEPK
jgi:hypothetical protein